MSQYIQSILNQGYQLTGGIAPVTSTLVLVGRDLSGSHTVLQWAGPPSGSVLEVQNAQTKRIDNLRIELAAGHPDAPGCGIGLNGTGQNNNRARIDGVWCEGLQRGFLSFGANQANDFHRLEGCTAKNCGTGIEVGQPMNTNWSIVRCALLTCPIGLKTASACRIDDTYFSHCGVDIIADGSVAPTSTRRIVGTWVSEHADTHIRLTAPAHVHGRGCSFVYNDGTQDGGPGVDPTPFIEMVGPYAQTVVLEASSFRHNGGQKLVIRVERHQGVTKRVRLTGDASLQVEVIETGDGPLVVEVDLVEQSGANGQQWTMEWS